MNIKVLILKNEVLVETETFVESDELRGRLSCNYSVEMEDKVLQINEQMIQYEWYKNEIKMDGETNKVLQFEEIDQKLNGTYECRIIVKKKQLIRSQQFYLIVYKCKKCNHQKLSFILTVYCLSKSKNK